MKTSATIIFNNSCDISNNRLLTGIYPACTKVSFDACINKWWENQQSFDLLGSECLKWII